MAINIAQNEPGAVAGIEFAHLAVIVVEIAGAERTRGGERSQCGFDLPKLTIDHEREGARLAVEVARYNIRVNTIHPNGVNTAMGQAPSPEALKKIGLDDHDLWLFGQVTASALPQGTQEPEDVAGTVAFLASDESRFMTGTMLHIGAGNQLM